MRRSPGQGHWLLLPIEFGDNDAVAPFWRAGKYKTPPGKRGFAITTPRVWGWGRGVEGSRTISSETSAANYTKVCLTANRSFFSGGVAKMH
jgi:hypothetical protein